MYTTVRVIQWILYAFFLLSPILIIIFGIVASKKRSIKMLTAIGVCMLYMLVYIFIIPLVPIRFNSLKKADFEQLAQHIVISEEDQSRLQSNEAYYENSFTTGYELKIGDDEVYSRMEITIYKFYDSSTAEKHDTMNDKKPVWQYTHHQGEDYQVYIRRPNNEKACVYPPLWNVVVYNHMFILQYQNYIVVMREVTNNPSSSLKECLYELIEMSPNLDFWIDHSYAYNKEVKITQPEHITIKGW